MSKMNAVALAETENNAVAVANGVDPLLAYADAIAPQHILAELMKFSKGDYIAGAKRHHPARDAVHRQRR